MLQGGDDKKQATGKLPTRNTKLCSGLWDFPGEFVPEAFDMPIQLLFSRSVYSQNKRAPSPLCRTFELQRQTLHDMC